jgi:hypothetical protein
MKRIVIALATLVGFSGVAFAYPTLDIGAGSSKVEATSYIAPASLPERDAQLATQP